MAGKVALIFIFNHRFDKNIEVLEKIYGHRFSYIYHIVPFYTGDKKNVIPVYENSYYFEGYLAQAYKHFFNEEYEDYFFVADDLILHPEINEDNYRVHFNLKAGDSFIPEVFSLNNFTNNDTLYVKGYKTIIEKKTNYHWWRIKQAVQYVHLNDGLENDKYLPPYTEAAEKLEQHGYDVRKPLTFHDVYGYFPNTLRSKSMRMQALRFLYRIGNYNRKFRLTYPMVASYSDILIVSKTSIRNFCQYCGVFATNHLFVEFAIPTALLLASNKVVTETETGKRGIIYWPQDEPTIYETAMKKFDYKLPLLMHNFPENKLYIHPIKLSKWQTTALSTNP